MGWGVLQRDSEDPWRAKDLREIEVAGTSMSNSDGGQKRTFPNTLSLEPKRGKGHDDKNKPIVAQSKNDNDEPKEIDP